MARAITLGNGHMLVGLDDKARVRDLYYPFVGLENHVSGASGSYSHRIGVWIDGVISWIDDDWWQMEATSTSGTANGVFKAQNEALDVALTIKDVLYNEKNIFLRHIVLKNNSKKKRTIKVFFSHQFRIEEGRRGATGFYDPRVHAVIHYKHRNTFLINATSCMKPFDDYTVGLFDIEGKTGSYCEAAKGELSKNPIEHGSVDSVVGVSCEIEGGGDTDIHYWLCAGSSIEEVHELNQYVIDETALRVHKSTEAYWSAWAKKSNTDLSNVEAALQKLYYESLFIIRAHTDNNGAIIASSDSDMLNGGRDTYSYMWPRDAALSALSLDRAGYSYITRQFYRFCSKLLTKDGYFMHKYCSNGALGSSWHPWMVDGKMQLPIQLDETALVIYALGKHYTYAKDLEFIESVYNSFIEPAAHFMCTYKDERTDLPGDTYDLWEEKYGSSTYTAAAAYGGLTAAAEFANMLGKFADGRRYKRRAEVIKKAILEHLYDEELSMFVKLIRHGEELSYDKTIDMSSFHGIVFFEVLDPHDARVEKAHTTVRDRLNIKTNVGGYVRYEGDRYYQKHPDASSNPWIITTLWEAQYQLKAARSTDELTYAKELLEWVEEKAHVTGVLPEQIDPDTGAHVSTTPLTWSHSEYVLTILEYAKRLRELPRVSVISDRVE